VNLAAHQLADPDLSLRVQRCIDAAGIDPSQLCLEITETAVMADITVSRGRLQALHDLGVKLAIDDFGTGYCSLAYIDLLPIDIIKIDGLFIARITEETESAALVASTILLAHTLGYAALVEGVETPNSSRCSDRCAVIKRKAFTSTARHPPWRSPPRSSANAGEEVRHVQHALSPPGAAGERVNPPERSHRGKRVCVVHRPRRHEPPQSAGITQ
jgi:predicted signal transduction protein with EAL and GGDEF domain